MKDWFEAEGKSVGLVTTSRVTHASPGALYAKSADRNWESDVDLVGKDANCNEDIAYQLVYNSSGIQVVMGGGRRSFLNKTTPDPQKGNVHSKHRLDGRDLTREWVKIQEGLGKRAKYVWNKEQFDQLSAENTDSVLGARIDHGHHDNYAKKALHDTVAFDDAVGVAQEMTGDDTLIVITADHSHVFSIAGYPKRGNNILGLVDPVDPGQETMDGMPYATLVYTNGPGPGRVNLTGVDTTADDHQQSRLVEFQPEWETHGGEDVAIYAHGPMAHLFYGVHEQSYIAHAMAYAACVGPNVKHCEQPGSDDPCGSSIINDTQYSKKYIKAEMQKAERLSPSETLSTAEQDKDGHFTGRVSRRDFPSCAGVKEQKDCSVSRETVEDHVSDYVKRNNNTGRELQKEYMRSSRSLRVEDGEVRVVEEVSFLFTNEVDVVRGVVVIDACNGQQLEERNMKAAIDEKHRENQEHGRKKYVTQFVGSCLYFGSPVLFLLIIIIVAIVVVIAVVIIVIVVIIDIVTIVIVIVVIIVIVIIVVIIIVIIVTVIGPDDATENGGNSPSLDVAFGLQTIFRVFREWYDMEAPVPSPTACVHYVCHEYAHLITEKYSNLQHDGQAGGVNDAFADAFSRACRKFTGIDDTWYEGSGLLVNYPQGFRCYADPTFDGFSIDNLSDYEAGMDSHRSCGIFNKFFYCLTETQGTTTIRDGFLTYLLANELFWAPDTSFEDAACGILRSSVLAGVNTESVRTCFGSVGVSLDSCSLDSVEQVLSEGFTVKTNPDVTIMVSTGSAYAEPEVSGVGKVKFNGDVDSDVFVRLQGSSDEREQVDIRVKF
nr:hypothetical protein BaRGS_032477 [Batillaria attramentaria]